jgi:hypothetical protein
VAAISKPPAVAGSGPSRTAAPRTAAPALAASATLADLRWLYPFLVLGGCIAVMVSRRSAWQVLQRRLAPGGPGHV